MCGVFSTVGYFSLLSSPSIVIKKNENSDLCLLPLIFSSFWLLVFEVCWRADKIKGLIAWFRGCFEACIALVKGISFRLCFLEMKLFFELPDGLVGEDGAVLLSCVAILRCYLVLYSCVLGQAHISFRILLDGFTHLIFGRRKKKKAPRSYEMKLF